MRVVFVEQESQLGGVQITTIQTASGLDRQHFEPLVVCPQDGPLAHLLKQAQVPYSIVSRPRFSPLTTRVGERYVANPFAGIVTALAVVRAALRLVSFIRTRADVIVTKGLLAHFYGGLAASIAGLPCVWHVQEVANSSSLGGLYGRVLNAAAHQWAYVIVVDALSVCAQFAPDLVASGRVRLIYNGIDTQRFMPEGRAADLSAAIDTENPIVIGNVGRLVPLKGQHVLVRAFARLARTWPNAHLVLAGTPLFDSDHYLNRLRNLASEAALADRIHFLGFRTDIPELLRSFTVFVHPSVEADSPVSLQEAMATGCAIVATSVPGTIDLLADGHDGHLVPPDDVQALAAAIDALLADPSRRRRMAQAARQTAEHRYARKVYLRSFEAVLREARGT